MKKLLENKWLIIVYGLLLAGVGALTLTYAIIRPEAVTVAISIALAVALFIIGLMHIIISLVAHTGDFFNTSLLLGSAAIAIGVVLCIDRTLIGQFIVYLLGAFFIAFAAIAIVKFVLFIVYKQKILWIVAYILFALVSAAIGILVLCFRNETTQVLYGIIGSFIILIGIFEIAYGIRELVNSNKKDAEPKTKKDEVVIEAEQKAEDNKEEDPAA